MSLLLGGFQTTLAARAFELVRQAYLVLDREFRFVYMNGEAEQLMGCDRTAYLERVVWEAFPDLIGTKLEIEYRKVASERVSSEFEHYYPAWKRWFHLQIDPLEGGIIVAFRDITQQKTLQEELAQSKDVLELVCESAIVGSFRWSFREDRVVASPEVCQFYGIKPEEAQPLSAFWFGLVHPEDRAKLTAQVGQAIADRARDLNYDFRTGFHQGSWRWVHSRAHIRYDDQGQPLLMVGINIDITRQKNLEEQLRKKLEELEGLMDVVPVAIAVSHDPEGRDIRVNSAFERRLGTRSANGLRCNRDLPHQAAAKSGKPVEPLEFEVDTQDGRRLCLYGAAAPLFEADGSVRGSIAAYFDMTELRAADAKIRASHAQLKRLVDSNIAGIVMGREAEITDANELYLQMLGYTRQDLEEGRVSWVDATPPEDLARDWQALEELRERGFCSPMEKVYIRRDGTRVPVLIGGAALTQKPELTWIGLAVDLSAQKALDEELQRANDRLAHSNEELQRFAYVVAHDLQSPLRTISSMTTLLARRLRSHLSADDLELANYVQSSVKQMAALIADLLEYSRAATEEPVTKPVDCESLFEQILASLQTPIADAGAIVSAGPLPLVRAGDQLARVFQNVIDNALKYRSERRPEIHMSAERSGALWIFSVRDNGIGFEMAYAERIFGVFQRLHGSGKYEGTGIGLAICRKVIERYGGSMWAESEPGVGSTFYFSLPAAAQS